MPPSAHKQLWSEPTFNRECGSCYACCVYLGIEELKKFSGQTCKHLHGGTDPTKRCTIYDKRPHACSMYECVWRAGFGPDNLRPYDSGMLITIYRSENKPDHAAATIIVTDEAKADAFGTQQVAIELLMLPTINEVRLVNYKRKRAVLFYDGKVYRCKLMPPDGYEALVFSADVDHPVGNYELRYVDVEDSGGNSAAHEQI